jgi:hypothetical protein
VRCGALHSKIGEAWPEIGLFGPKRERPKQLQIQGERHSFIALWWVFAEGEPINKA